MARLGIALMTEARWAQATLPLFEAGEIDAIEWSVDVGWEETVPVWTAGLIDHFAAAGALYGHGVHLSPLSAEWSARQRGWIDRMRDEARARRYVHVSEHFGWSTAGPFVRGAPMPLPRSEPALRIGRDRMSRLADACERPVGLENLALALSVRDVEALPDFLDALVDPVDGFLILDLHNLYCQAINYALDPIALIERYPRARVRELHVSGGRWEQAAGRRFRRDTHDDAIPREVIALLRSALDHFAIEVVVVERLGDTLRTPAQHETFRAEVREVRALAHSTTNAPSAATHKRASISTDAAHDPDLAHAQASWLCALAGAPAEDHALRAWTDGGDPAALETARALGAKWLRR